MLFPGIFRRTAPFKENPTMRILSSVPLLAILSCAACASTPSDPPAGTESPGECRAEPAQQYIGRKADTQIVDAAKRASTSQQVRVIGPDDAVTLDYRTDRLDIRVDADRTIVAITCG
jgi:hypothetical protein